MGEWLHALPQVRKLLSLGRHWSTYLAYFFKLEHVVLMLVSLEWQDQALTELTGVCVEQHSRPHC